MADLFASASGPDSLKCIRIPAQLCRTGVCVETSRRGHKCLNTSTQLAMLYYMDSKKHLPGRIVPLRVPFPEYACINVHVQTVKRDAGYKHLCSFLFLLFTFSFFLVFIQFPICVFPYVPFLRHYMHRYDLSFGQAGLSGSCAYALRSR